MKDKRLDRMKTMIRKHIETMKQSHWSQEARPGSEEQYEENKVNCIEELKCALKEDSIEGLEWCAEEAARLERKGGFDAIYTDDLLRRLAATDEPMSWQEWRGGLTKIESFGDFIASLDLDLYEKAKKGESFSFRASTKNKDKGSLERLWEDFIVENGKYYGRGVVSGGMEEHVSAANIPNQEDIKPSYSRYEVERLSKEADILWGRSTAGSYGACTVTCRIKHTVFVALAPSHTHMTISRKEDTATLHCRRDTVVLKSFSSLEKGEEVNWYVMEDGKERYRGVAEIIRGDILLFSSSILGPTRRDFPLWCAVAK